MGIRDTSTRLAGDSARLVTDTAHAATSVAGAVGGAALGGLAGSVRGAVDGAREGLSKGSGSTPAAAATLAALGITGLVEWPVLAAVGGSALAVTLLTGNRHSPQGPGRATPRATTPTEKSGASSNSVPPGGPATKTNSSPTARSSRTAKAEA
ncbi:hypothetical protein [Rhodococcus sp. NPDC047139]|uniref:hypothetical protein n=1 Tax=Rhodococcus sp. NPDC047139 TaxID=3155141 RepID=UPI0034046263